MTASGVSSVQLTGSAAVVALNYIAEDALIQVSALQRMAIALRESEGEVEEYYNSDGLVCFRHKEQNRERNAE